MSEPLTLEEYGRQQAAKPIFLSDLNCPRGETHRLSDNVYLVNPSDPRAQLPGGFGVREWAQDREYGWRATYANGVPSKPLTFSELEKECGTMGYNPDETLVDYLMKHRHVSEMTLAANDYRLLVMSQGNAWGNHRWQVFQGGVKFAGPVGVVTIRPAANEG